MRLLVLPLALVAVFGVTSVALAQQEPESAPASKPAKPAIDDPNRVVCTRERVVGSNRPVKVCMTVARRQELRDMAKLNGGDSVPNDDAGPAQGVAVGGKP